MNRVFFNKIFFNKIFECYNYYKKENIHITQKGKLITFLNILVIELYEYYTKIKFDEPIYNILNNFYKNLLMEIYDIINQKDKDAEDKKIEEKNEININLNMNNTTKNLTSRDRYMTYHTKNKNETNNGNQILTSRDNYPRKTVNILRSKAIREDKNKLGYGKTIFNNLKKEKPIKLGNQYHQEENQIKINKNKITTSMSLEEEIVTELMNIKMLFSFEEPKKRDLDSVKNKIPFYKNIKKLIPEFIGKSQQEQEHPKGRHVMLKSVTIGNVNKKNKLKLHNNEGYFDVLDWDKSEIGEKLISLSKILINKVHRREIYKAIFLKKEKYEQKRKSNHYK